MTVATALRASLGALWLSACVVDGGESPPEQSPGTSRNAVAAADSVATDDDALRDVSVLGQFTHRDLKESSGVAPSRVSPNVFWSHNDSGNNTRLFAFDSTGRDLGVVRLTSAVNRDWEAMASGPCAEGSCLYIGEVGDNLAVHKVVGIYRVPEPVPPGLGRMISAPVTGTLRFVYPDGPRDVESMWVDADTVVWLVNKRRQRVAGKNRQALVYRLPASAWRDTGVVVAELVDSLPMVPTNRRGTLITDAAVSPTIAPGDSTYRLAVRTYERLYIFATRGAGRPGALLGECSLLPLKEPQGEAVAWLPDGRVMLASEERGASMHAARCP